MARRTSIDSSNISLRSRVVDAERGELALEVARAADSVNRPPLSRSSVAPAFATMNGLRYGNTTTLGIRRIVCVAAAANAMATNGSSASCPPAFEPLVRRRRVIGEADAAEARRLRGACNAGIAVAGHQRRVVRVRHHRVGRGELHASSALPAVDGELVAQRGGVGVGQRSERCFGVGFHHTASAVSHRWARSGLRLTLPVAVTGIASTTRTNARRPLRADVGLRGEERVERVGVEGRRRIRCAAMTQVAGARVGHRIHDDGAHAGEPGDHVLDRTGGEILAVDAQPVRRCDRRRRTCRRRCGTPRSPVQYQPSRPRASVASALL